MVRTPMIPPIVIQTTEMMEHRMAEQLRRKRMDVASLYSIGGPPTAQAWKEWDDRYPLPWDITRGLIGDHYGGEQCVVDLGSGTGRTCLAAIGSVLDHIGEVVLVDVSPEMLSIAQGYLQRNTPATITCVMPTSCRTRPRSMSRLMIFRNPDFSSV
jgi:SAM-dependent methyltransferase